MNSIEEAVKKLLSSSGSGKTQSVGTASTYHGFEDRNLVSDSTGRVMCHIDQARLRGLGFLTPDAADGVLVEQYRVLKRPLIVNAFNKGPDRVENSNSIMVTSSLEGEGKTYTSFNLAISMAMERDYTVLLIDSDVIKASLSSLLGLRENLGLIDLLLNPDMELSDVIVSTDIPRLKILPAGKPNIHSTELLASEQMSRLSRELSNRYSDRIILYDAPPLLATSQAKVLLSLAGQVLLVVEAGGTPQDLVLESASQLDNDKIVGVVLNKSRSTNAGYYGGYYGSTR